MKPYSIARLGLAYVLEDRQVFPAHSVQDNFEYPVYPKVQSHSAPLISLGGWIRNTHDGVFDDHFYDTR